MELNKLVECDSSYCKSYYVIDNGPRREGHNSRNFDVIITYHNGSVYLFPMFNTSAWEGAYAETQSVGKSFWASLEPNSSVKISNG